MVYFSTASSTIFLVLALPGNQWEGFALTVFLQSIQCRSLKCTRLERVWAWTLSGLCDLSNGRHACSPTVVASDPQSFGQSPSDRPQTRKWKHTFQHDVTLKPTDATFQQLSFINHGVKKSRGSEQMILSANGGEKGSAAISVWIALLRIGFFVDLNWRFFVKICQLFGHDPKQD